MSTASITRDERTMAVENASYRWGYLLLAFGLLLSTAYRAFVREESSWDLLALVLLSGVVTTALQWRRHTLSRRSALFAAIALGAALVVAVVTSAAGRAYTASAAAYKAAAAAKDAKK
jgi:hypothetical protein